MRFTSLKNYTLKYLASAILVIIAVWATIFYTFLIDEVYDNIDDGLRDLKIQIIREAYIDDNIMNINTYGFNQFRITPVKQSDYKDENFFKTELHYMEYEGDIEPYRILKTYFIGKDERPYRLEIRTSMVEEDEFRQNLLIALIVLYIVVVISIIAINHIILRKTWKPFYNTLNKLGNYQIGKGNYQENNPTHIREFAHLNSEIDRMIARNERTFKNQKQFIENASHELQTPLAIAINKIEMLIDGENLSENQIVELSQTRDILLKLSKLNKSLLMFSRIENNQFMQRELIDFNILAENVADDFSDMLAFKEISLKMAQKGRFKVFIHSDLAYILISNLMRNAIKYNQKGGEIQIEISEDFFQIKNTSNIDNSLDKELIFNRFYKATQDTTSTGLGLSIVKTIVDNTPNLSIDYQFKDHFHIFSIRN